jgi:hypothetical protein
MYVCMCGLNDRRRRADHLRCEECSEDVFLQITDSHTLQVGEAFYTLFSFIMFCSLCVCMYGGLFDSQLAISLRLYWTPVITKTQAQVRVPWTTRSLHSTGDEHLCGVM